LPTAGAIAASGALVWLVLWLVPFSAAGSSQGSNAIASLLSGCAEDEGEAVAGGFSERGAQAGCRTRAVVQLVAGGAALAVAGASTAVASSIVVRRRS
jgi:hypothetical protein